MLLKDTALMLRFTIEPDELINDCEQEIILGRLFIEKYSTWGCKGLQNGRTPMKTKYA